MKQRLDFRKLPIAEYKMFSKLIFRPPSRKSALVIIFTGTDIVCRMFSEESSHFNIRWKCLNVETGEVKDFASYTVRGKKECKRFRLGTLTEYSFKCLTFAQGLTDAEIREDILSKLEMNQDLTLQKLSEKDIKFKA